MYSKNIHDEIPEKFQERFNLIKEDKNLEFRHIKKKELYNHLNNNGRLSNGKSFLLVNLSTINPEKNNVATVKTE